MGVFSTQQGRKSNFADVWDAYTPDRVGNPLPDFMLGFPNSFTGKYWKACQYHFAITQMVNCFFCGVHFVRGTRAKPTLDHVVPVPRFREFGLSHLEGHYIDNLVVCCSSCNSRKGNWTWEELCPEADAAINKLRSYGYTHPMGRFNFA